MERTVAEVADDLLRISDRQREANPELSRELEALALIVRRGDSDPSTMVYRAWSRSIDAIEVNGTVLAEVRDLLKGLSLAGGGAGSTAGAGSNGTDSGAGSNSNSNGNGTNPTTARVPFDWNKALSYWEVRAAIVLLPVALVLWVIGTMTLSVWTPDGYRVGPAGEVAAGENVTDDVNDDEDQSLPDMAPSEPDEPDECPDNPSLPEPPRDVPIPPMDRRSPSFSTRPVPTLTLLVY